MWSKTVLLSVRQCLLRVLRKVFSLMGFRGISELLTSYISNPEIIRLLVERFDENVPPDIIVEITSDCNYRCPFCPQSSYQRESRYMSTQDFNMLVRQLDEINYCGNVALFVNNEPFLHPEILEFCRVLSEQLPDAGCFMTSNGSLITKEHLRALATLRKPPRIDVNDYLGDGIMVDRLKNYLTEIELDYGVKLDIVFKKRSYSEKLSNRAGNQPVNRFREKQLRRVVCTWPFTAMFVRYDLKVFLCCSDYQHEIILGDLRTNSIMEVWACECFRETRCKMLATQRSELKLCKRCDLDWFSLPRHCV